MQPLALALFIVVRTYDMFGLPAVDRDTATRVASGILRAAAIDSVWVDCTLTTRTAMQAACAAPIGPGELIVRILAGGAGITGSETLGFAYVDGTARRGTLATVYADRVASAAHAAGMDAGRLLGRALAHEAGHLLLGTTTHPPRGVMRGTWSRRLLQRSVDDAWLFSRAEAEEMRDRLGERVQTLTSREQYGRPASAPRRPVPPESQASHDGVEFPCEAPSRESRNVQVPSVPPVEPCGPRPGTHSR
jgi:hypothetical protein